MEHISNMGHSLDAIKFIADLHVAIGSPTVNIYIKETYPFFDEDAYKDEVEKYLVENNNDDLRRILKRHLSTCEQIIEIWDERKELWEARSRLKVGRENNEDTNVSYDIYCILGGRRNNSMRFYGKVLLLRNINGKVEERSPFIPFTLFDKSWREYNLEIHPIPDTDRETLTVHLVRYAEIIRRFLREYVSNEESVPIAEQVEQRLDISPDVLMWLQKTICTNGVAYIEDATTKPLKWLQNKQLARELLTHDKIRGSLTIAEVERKAPIIFIDKDCKPLCLAKPKKVPSSDSDKLSNYLATL